MNNNRAKAYILMAVDAASDEGFTGIDIHTLWGGVLCPYMSWATYMDALKQLADAKVFDVAD